MLSPRINSTAKQIRQILLGLHFTYHHLFSDQDVFMILDNYKSVRTDYFWNPIEKPIEQTFNSLKEILTSDAPS